VRDIVLIGGSAGAIEALLHLLRTLPSDFPAAIFVVVHTSAEGSGLLDRVLSRAGGLPAQYAVHGECFYPSRIYVAPPDHHLTLGVDHNVHVRRGPRENGARPAIDPLFRSAVLGGYSQRAIAVVLSGYLDDGSAGFHVLRDRGAIGIVQDPSEALAEGMPTSALNRAGADYVLPARDIGHKVLELVNGSGKAVTTKETRKKTCGEARTHRGSPERIRRISR
jgi:two-component system, chemotaxis family, protein-glutamate methylesterase/glutaminase